MGGNGRPIKVTLIVIVVVVTASVPAAVVLVVALPGVALVVVVAHGDKDRTTSSISSSCMGVMPEDTGLLIIGDNELC